MIKYIFILLILTSCISSKIPTNDNWFSGTIITCKTDSTSLTSDSLVLIKRHSNCKGRDCRFYANPNCDNRPDFYAFCMFWPSNIILNLKNKTYTTLHSARPVDPNIKYGDPNFNVRYSFDTGKIKYDKKHSTLILKSIASNWTRTFVVEYSKEDSILILKYKNGI